MMLTRDEEVWVRAYLALAPMVGTKVAFDAADAVIEGFHNRFPHPDDKHDVTSCNCWRCTDARRYAAELFGRVKPGTPFKE